MAFANDIIASLYKDIRQTKQLFLEELDKAQLDVAFPGQDSIGVDSTGKPISKEDIINQSASLEVAQANDGSKILTDPKTGKITIVSDKPNNVAIKSQSDIEKLKQLAITAQQLASNKPSNTTQPNIQQQAHQNNIAQQRAAQQKQSNIAEETSVESLVAEILSIINSIQDSSESEDTSEESTSESSSKEESSNNTEEATEDTDKESKTVTVNQVDDNFSQPTDIFASGVLNNTFWQPANQNDDLLNTVKAAQNNIGIVATPVQLKPSQMPVPNMASYVKTNMSPAIGNGDLTSEFDSILGIDNPIGIKLALAIG